MVDYDFDDPYAGWWFWGEPEEDKPQPEGGGDG